jgi:hypothetical protein
VSEEYGKAIGRIQAEDGALKMYDEEELKRSGDYAPSLDEWVRETMVAWEEEMEAVEAGSAASSSSSPNPLKYYLEPYKEWANEALDRFSGSYISCPRG